MVNRFNLFYLRSLETFLWIREPLGGGGIICDTVLRVYMVQVRYKAGHVKDTEKGGKN